MVAVNGEHDHVIRHKEEDAHGQLDEHHVVVRQHALFVAGERRVLHHRISRHGIRGLSGRYVQIRKDWLGDLGSLDIHSLGGEKGPSGQLALGRRNGTFGDLRTSLQTGSNA